MAKAKTSGQLVKQLTPHFQRYIRERDKNKPCISCLEYKDDKDAGHFYAKGGYAGLRFDEDNVHGECKKCNRFDDSHLIGYTENLKERIGERDFNALRKRAKEYKKNGRNFSRGELKEMIIYYKEKNASQ